MITVEQREAIRRAYYIEQKSVRQIAREHGHSRKTVDKAIASAIPAPYQRTQPRLAPVLGPYHGRIADLLAANERLPRKQHYTGHKIFELLQAEGYQGSEVGVRNYLSQLRKDKQRPAVFVPLEFDPGQDAQVDWGEAVAIIAGERQTIQLFVMRLNYSRRAFVMAFPSQKQESFFWGHVQAFEHFGGVPHRMSYDNLAAAVKILVEGRVRREQRAFVAFRSHYLFESHFCTPGQGHEKGGVEHLVGFSRRNFLVPVPEVASFEELNGKLVVDCLRDDGRRVQGQGLTIGQLAEQERPFLRALPASAYPCCVTTSACLTPYSQVIFETNRYSVPVERARREVIVKAYPFYVELWHQTQLLARHPRCYGREQDIFDPLHYLPLLEQRPGAFEYAKPLRRWREGWPESYRRMLQLLREKWPEGRGVQEFVRILQLHQHYPVPRLEAAIEQALAYGCVHLDGVRHCLEQGATHEQSKPSLELADRPQLQAIGSQPVDLRRYEQLLETLR